MLLERSEQLGVFRDALAEVVRRSCGAIALVSGEAGIGKTALVREFCGEPGRQVRVLWAACDPLFTPRPLGPLLDLAASPGVGSGALVHDGARPFDVAVGLLRELGSAGPAVLVLEDVHWADEATFDVISLLARRLRHVPALLVLSYRDDQLGRSHPLRIVLGDLPADVIRVRIELDGLSPDAVRVLAEPAGVDPERLHGRTAGNPFFVTEALAGGSERIPATVRDAVLARTARLGQHALAVLDVVAVVPGRAELWLVEALAIEAQSGLDDCLGSGMLVTDGAWVMFRHEIARMAVEDSLPPAHRAALHRRVLAALTERAGQAGTEPDLARLAHHAEAAGDADAVLRFAPAAAEQAAAAAARREAVAEYERALRFADRLAPLDRARLLERFAGEGYFTGGGESATSALKDALEIYQNVGDVAGQGRTLRQLGKQFGLDGAITESRAALRESVYLLERIPPGAELARTYASLSANYALTDECEALRSGTRAIALAEETGCTDALIYALNNVGTIELRRGDPGGMAKLERSRDLARNAGDEVGVGRAFLHLALVLIAHRDWERADRYLGPAISYCRERGLDAWLNWLITLRAESELARGHWHDAASIATSMLDRGSRGFSHARCTALVILGRVLARRGEAGYWPLLDEASTLVKSVSMPQSQILVAAARAEAAWLEGASGARIAEETERALTPDLKGLSWFAGEIACWRWRAGLPCDDPSCLAEPYRLEITGDGTGAARWWHERQCPYEAALALAGSSEVSDLRQALDLLRELGARPAAAIVARRLRALGERGVPRGPRPGTSASPAGLTERETQVIALLAAGMTNTAIAGQLVVSTRTVDHHVASILRKLGVPTRAEAIIEAGRRGLVNPSSGVRGNNLG